MSTFSQYMSMQIAFFTSFCAVAAMIWLQQRYVPAASTWLPRFAEFLQHRAFLSTTGQERNKIALMRFFFGLVILFRALDVAGLLIPEEYFSPVGIYNALEIVFSLFIMFGFCTQWSLGFFIFVMWHLGERALGTSTLGNDVGAMFAVFFLLTEAGRTLSVDAWIVRRVPRLRAVFGYNANLPGKTVIALAKFLLITSYWLVCMYSLSMHLGESAWMTGLTGPMLFVSNFMSRFHALFEPFFLQSTFVVFAARLTLFVMMVWYVVLMPWVAIGGWWRRAVIIWGVLFYFLSAFVLQLGSLAYIELLIWITCFWPGWGVDSTKKLLLFYDDKCNLCDRTVQFVRLVDIFDRVTLTPVSRNAEHLAQYGIQTDAALEDLHGVLADTRDVRAGYALYELLARHLVLLWVLIPILWLGRVLWVGPALYRYIAARRRAMFGVCALPRPKTVWSDGKDAPDVVSWLFTVIFWHVLVLGAFYAALMPMPYIGVKGVRSNPLVIAAAVYGIAPINVFNSTDLHMIDNWFTLTDAQSGELLPILAADGSRLAYHRSDRIYFGNTLRFRRGEIGKDDCAFNRRAASIKYLAQVWMAESALTGTRSIVYTQYYQEHPDQKLLLDNVYQVHPIVVRCTVTFDSTR